RGGGPHTEEDVLRRILCVAPVPERTPREGDDATEVALHEELAGGAVAGPGPQHQRFVGVVHGPCVPRYRRAPPAGPTGSWREGSSPGSREAVEVSRGTSLGSTPGRVSHSEPRARRLGVVPRVVPGLSGSVVTPLVAGGDLVLGEHPVAIRVQLA